MVDKYTFKREFTDLYGQTKIVEHTVEGETLDELLESFLYFLNGCSFSYVKDLIFVKEDGQEVSVMDWDSSIYSSVQGGGDMTIDTVDDLDQFTIDLTKNYNKDSSPDGC